MNGIFHLGPTIGPLFQTYLTEKCSVARQAEQGRIGNISKFPNPH